MERDAWRLTPLHAAAERGHRRVAMLLREAVVKDITVKKLLCTVLHEADTGR